MSTKALDFFTKRSKPGILPSGAFEGNGQELIFVEQKRKYITSFTAEQNKTNIIFITEAFTHFVGVQVGSILKSDNWGVADAQLKPGGRAHYI